MQDVQIDQGLVELAARACHVVHAHAHRDDVGSHGHGLGQLPVQHVADPLATDREIGVLDTRGVAVEQPGQPIGEADEAPVSSVSQSPSVWLSPKAT